MPDTLFSVPKQSEAEFLVAMEAADFEVAPVQFDAGTTFEDHSHDFESRIRITAGSLTITADGVRSVLRANDVYQLAENAIHHETVGEGGVRYLSARPRK
jgi:quercetin dioxygenase-like cupin family protein